MRHVDLKCKCGRHLGKFAGKFDIRCRCKKIVKGETVQIGDFTFAVIEDPEMPEGEMVLRSGNGPDQVIRVIGMKN